MQTVFMWLCLAVIGLTAAAIVGVIVWRGTGLPRHVPLPEPADWRPFSQHPDEAD
jgi:hypothetical protein